MEPLPLTRTYLESLATADLIKLADDFGIDIPENPDRILIIEELFEFSSVDDNGTDDSMEQKLKQIVSVESVPLPRYYNITFIEVMIRDPFWAFVFWEIKAFDKEELEKNAAFNGYYLKVSLFEKEALMAEEIFTVHVKSDDTAWYISFAPAYEKENLGEDPRRYKVELCVDLGGVETVLAASGMIILPGLPELPNRTGKQEAVTGDNLFARLSGSDDFHILRRNERQLKTKKGDQASANE
jgi:hypothetical protein